MNVLSESEMDRNSFLDQATTEGTVEIRRSNGQRLVVDVRKPQQSPFDVPTPNLNVPIEEIVAAVREGREEH